MGFDDLVTLHGFIYQYEKNKNLLTNTWAVLSSGLSLVPQNTILKLQKRTACCSAIDVSGAALPGHEVGQGPGHGESSVPTEARAPSGRNSPRSPSETDGFVLLPTFGCNNNDMNSISSKS